MWQPVLDWFSWPEFRIPTPPLPAEITRRLAELLTAFPSTPIPPPGPSPEMCRFLADTAVFLWRMQQRAAKPDCGLDRKTAFQIERLAGVLKQAGVETLDRTGQQYKTGDDDRVVAFQPSGAVRVPTVRETVQPYVFFGSQMLLRADIIVDEPDAPPAAPPEQLAAVAAASPSAQADPTPVDNSPFPSANTPSDNQTNSIPPP